MRKVFVLLLMAISLTATAKKEKVKKVLTPTELVSSLKWTHEAGKKTDVAALDEILVAGDSLYAHVQKLVGGMTFYDVKKIAIAETGDTIVAVVDEQGNIRDRYKAVFQYIEAGKAATILSSDIVKTSKEAIDLKDHFKEIVDIKDPLKSISLVSTLATAIKQIGKMGEVVKVGLVDNFAAQKSKIRTYIKEADQASGLNDPKLRNLPGVTLSDDVLTKSEQEVTASLEKIKQEEEITKGGVGAEDMLNALDSL
ncbi:MAG: hypothetical protein ACI3Y0_08660 [Prevotella sp.]